MKEQIETVLHESPELESFVERLVPSVVDFTLLHVSTVKSTILEVGNIELFELNEVISSFLRIMLFFCILSSAVLPKNEKPITESGDEISYEGAKAKHPISLLLGLRRRSTAHVKFGPSHHERKESIGAPIKLDVEAHAHIQKHSPKASTNPLNISLTMEGGSVFPINDPIITITDTISNPMAYCLAAMKSEGVNLIGENFMSGLKVVFDRERNVLGWKNFDCYSVGNSRSNLLVNSNPSCVPPRPALGPNSYTPEATKGASPNGTQVNVLQPSASFSPKLHCNRNVLVAAALLFLLIL
uniref:Peptidase A1 domain-containing protein n=1 Tax=Zea mays TaxID=4577 RepID=A0A804Q8E8_MAIZE